jgi:hypothetical protein
VPILLVRPYPVQHLAKAAHAISVAADGDYSELHALYELACDALEDIDPDEVHLHILEHTEVGDLDKATLRAALSVHGTWEGVVSIATSIVGTARFRAFVVACAYHRYVGRKKVNNRQLRAWGAGQPLPGVSAHDTALFAALPMLMGLGPELPDEIKEPCPVQGEPVWSVLGLLEGDWAGVDPIDGTAITAEVCRDACASATGVWRDSLARGSEHGLLIRRSD